MIRQIILITAALVLSCIIASQAQAPGSESVYGGSTSVKSILSGGTSSDVSESLYIGPGTHVIDGTWEIYAQRVIIDPLAVITGTGSIQVYNPGDLVSIYPAAVSMATSIDGNAPSGAANNIDVNIQHFNNAGIQLTNMGFPADLIIDGWMNNTSASTLYVGKDLSLEVDGADVTLGTGVVGDLRFDDDATISNYRPERMVIVNNSILSHMVKENYTSAFTFPVGIADGDYTPAQITNLSAITVNVGVQDYVVSISPEQTADPGPGGIPSDGMNRTWHIFGDAAGTGTTVNLQHNSSSNQSAFNDASHFVTQWGSVAPNPTGDNTIAFSSSPWQSNTPATGATGTMLTPSGTLAGSTMRSRAYTSLATAPTAEESYFTKSSDPIHPLPVKLISFAAASQSCDVVLDWTVGVENGISAYNIQHSTDGSRYNTVGTVEPKGNNATYHYVHAQAVKGLNIYRLQMVENNGQYTVSPVEKLDINCEGIINSAPSIIVYPNPTSGVVTVDGMLSKTPSTIRVMNLHGQILQEMNTVNTKETIDVSAYPAASYILQVIQQDQVKLNVRMVKQ